MNTFKKIILSLFIALSTVTINVPVTSPIVEVQAATIKLNKTSTVLYKGKTTTLKITGTSKTVKWTSSNKNIASVTSKGKVTAKKAGTAYIYAKVNGKTYKCKVTVKNPVSTSVYITKTGKKYHRISNCGNSKYVSKVTLTYAKNKGYTACKKCY